jgi:hypothetical protein
VIDERLIGAALDRNLGRPGNLAPGENVEQELDNFIASRHDRRMRGENERAEEARGRALAAYGEGVLRPLDLERLMPRAGAMA